MITKHWLQGTCTALALAVAGTMGFFFVGTGKAWAGSAEDLLNARCAACHERLPDDGLARVSEARKTPEGWDMTIVRMMMLHGVEITADERRTLVKHLADTQGLAPEETEGYRYALDRDPNAIEDFPTEELGLTCGRCHTWARVALQRRDTEEWVKHAHFHIGQWPTTEYQFLGRDRDWFDIAKGPVAEKLGEMLPLETSEWSAWQNAEWPDLAGEWRLAGHQPGAGDYEGTATVEGTGTDTYSIELEATSDDGSTFAGSGSANVYTGYEWRGSLAVAREPGVVGAENIRQVYAASKDGNSMSGRWFLAEFDERGGTSHWVKVRPGHAEILAVHPAYLKAGQTAHIAVHGTGLSGGVSLGDGVEILATVEESPGTVEVVARAAAGAASGARDVAVGGATASGAFTVYQKIDSVRVEPWYAITRVGDAGGQLPKVTAQFEAVAYLNGPDGQAGTEDDVRIGVMDAEWKVENFDELAAELQDVKYSGTMEETGRFVPAAAGLNPERPFATNNAGRLRVVATVTDGEIAHEGHAELLATVQRWNDPPIR